MRTTLRALVRVENGGLREEAAHVTTSKKAMTHEL
jgi:hypothetical protein